MNNRDIVKTYITALQSGDIDMATGYMAENFVLRGWMPLTLERGQFLAMQSELLASMPDLNYNLSDLQEESSVVRGFIRIDGTQTRDLALAIEGVQPIPATGLTVSLPQVPVTFTLKDGKIVEMAMEAVPGGGLGGLLQQIGGELPVAPRLGTMSW